MDLHCDLDTAVLIGFNLIGWSLFLGVMLRDRLTHFSRTQTSHATR